MHVLTRAIDYVECDPLPVRRYARPMLGASATRQPGELAGRRRECPDVEAAAAIGLKHDASPIGQPSASRIHKLARRPPLPRGEVCDTFGRAWKRPEIAVALLGDGENLLITWRDRK